MAEDSLTTKKKRLSYQSFFLVPILCKLTNLRRAPRLSLTNTLKYGIMLSKEERRMKVTTLYLSKKQIPFAEYYPKFVNSMYIKYIVVGAEQRLRCTKYLS